MVRHARRVTGASLVLAGIGLCLALPASSHTAANAPPIVVLKARVIYEPDQTGGPFHEVLALVRNTTGSWKTVNGQFSIRQGGRLVGTPDAIPIQLAPHAEGILTAEAVKLPRPVMRGVVTLTTDAESPFTTPPKTNAIRLTAPRYVKGGGAFGRCSLKVTATNTTSKRMGSATISMVGLRSGKIVTGGSTYEALYPRTPKIVEIDIPSPALCPVRVDQVRASWSLY